MLPKPLVLINEVGLPGKRGTEFLVSSSCNRPLGTLEA